MRFHAIVEAAGKTATGIEVPGEVVDALGAGRRPAVSVTINGHTYRSTVAVMGGRNLVGVSAENRKAAGVAAGDEIEVDIMLDSAPREVVVPPDFAAALEIDPAAKATFTALSYSNRLRHVLAIESAKTPETRQRRVLKTWAALRDA